MIRARSPSCAPTSARAPDRPPDGQLGGVLAATAVEQGERGARPEPQHAQQVRRGRGRQQHFGAGSQLQFDINAGGTHLAGILASWAPSCSPAFSIDGATGLLREARQVLSPHCDERPPGCAPELIVVHGISLPPGEFGGPWIEQLFTGGLDPGAHPYFSAIAALRVSAHLLVRRNGEVVQFVPFGMRAWHAGASSWQGRTGLQRFFDRHRDGRHRRRRLRSGAVPDARRADHGAVPGLSDAGARAGRRAQRHRARSQERSGPGIRLAVAARVAGCPEGYRP